MNTNLLLPFAVDLYLKSAVVVILALLTLLLWRRASAAQRDCIWGATFLGIFALPVATLAAPHWSLSLPELARGRAMSDLTSDPVIALLSGASRAAPTVGRPGLDVATAILAVWAVGAILLLGYRWVGTSLLHRCRRASSPVRDGAVAARAQSIAESYGISQPVEIRQSDDCHVPVTWGTWRPVVMLPGKATNWPGEWLDAALRHELAHVKNFDHLKRWIAFLACAFYWPNPLVWLAARKFQAAQEEAGDNLVLGGGISPRDYARQLVEVIQAAGPHVLTLPVVAMARRSTTEGRLSALLDETRNRRGSDRWLAAGGFGTAVMLCGILGSAQLRADNPSSPDGYVPETTETDKAGYAETLEASLPGMDLPGVTGYEAMDALGKASQKANPRGLEVRWMIDSQSEAEFLKTKIDLKLAGGSLQDALAAIAKETGLQHRISPVYVYYVSDRDARFHPHIANVMCTFWAPRASEPMWDRILTVSDNGVRLLHLQPDDSGDVTESLQKWGIQFPAGAFATCQPQKSRPGQNDLTFRNTGDRMLQIINLEMAASPEYWKPAPAPPK